MKLIEYFASPYCTLIALNRFNCTLRQWCVSRDSVVDAPALDINTGIAAALAHIHSQGVIHSDIHAKNILLTCGTNSSRLVACLADFGIAQYFNVKANIARFGRSTRNASRCGAFLRERVSAAATTRRRHQMHDGIRAAQGHSKAVPRANVMYFAKLIKNIFDGVNS